MLFGVKSRNIALSYAAMVSLGLVFFIPILALWLEENLFTLTNVALIFGLQALSSAIFEVPTGAIADIFGRKNTLCLAYAAWFISTIVLFIGGKIWVYVIYAILSGLGGALASGTDVALVYES